MMLSVLLLSFISAFILCCILFPSVWASITALDENFDGHESGMLRVSSRNPFRETSDPVNMAKLIMLRHKMNQCNTRKRRTVSVSYTRQASRCSSPARSGRSPKTTWMRLGRARGRQSH
ncbi:hypothetical protein JAAARDRAFT_243336 [Jaapia argillacea MUCL 33604]|uniref:Secreted protein n=1 Tax=Jaapia argillacea MUCL 33604 TaxID=933084 RepID=A0A067QN36_9AGAM|nr:hypothetical protein JAAARDRAFT_243336 [Jaapia argillacea MUCL 33604]